MQAAREHGLVLNIDKCSIAQRQIPFFGHVYDEHGCHPDPAKVEAVHAMPRPTSRTKASRIPRDGDMVGPLHTQHV